MLRPQLEQLALATGQLTIRQCELIGNALAELDRLNRRKAALEAAVAALDPEGSLSSWQVAKALESRLRRFDGDVEHRRILSGHRRPTALETAMVGMLAAGGPRCHEKLYLELQALIA